MRKRRAHNLEHDDSHRWIVSYADFITLLFAFFVVMYAISSVNDSKYESLAHGMTSAFDKNAGDGARAENQRMKQGFSYTSDTDEGIKEFQGLSEKLSTLSDEDYKTKSQDGWIEINMSAGALFDSGSAEIRKEAISKLEDIAKMIQGNDYPIALEGYTDDIPISTPQYPSNWELSSARAAAVARILTEKGVNPKRISVTGYGEQYPLFKNITEEGRSKNRRVNMIIARDKSIQRLSDPQVGATMRFKEGQSSIVPIKDAQWEKK